MLSVMRTTIKYLGRTVLFICGMLDLCFLLGEPHEAMGIFDVLLVKGSALLGLVLVFKGYMMTLSKREREEIMNEEV